ncbi:MAG: nitroreductase family protein [Bacteroidales bacterium]|nr:nitroreductase family protein [Bacteroidales bacterium]MBQ6762520.1 nitroreductase family protein [Bacteroidales bacterium]
MKKFILILIAAVAVLSCKSAPQPAVVSFDDVIASRRSIRSFDASKTISEAEIRTLIATAQEAPSWANTQTSRYYVALSKEKADAVREVIGEWNKKNTEGAPVFIVSTYVKDKSGFRNDGIPANEVGNGWGAYDNGLSDAHLILKARAMGFDTLIMGGRDADALRSIFNIPEEEAIMAVLALGYRAVDPDRPARKPLDEILKFF